MGEAKRRREAVNRVIEYQDVATGERVTVRLAGDPMEFYRKLGEQVERQLRGDQARRRRRAMRRVQRMLLTRGRRNQPVTGPAPKPRHLPDRKARGRVALPAKTRGWRLRPPRSPGMHHLRTPPASLPGLRLPRLRVDQRARPVRRRSRATPVEVRTTEPGRPRLPRRAPNAWGSETSLWPPAREGIAAPSPWPRRFSAITRALTRPSTRSWNWLNCHPINSRRRWASTRAR